MPATLKHSLLAIVLLVCSGCYHVWKPLPAGTCYDGPRRPVDTVRFLADSTYVTAAGDRRCEQEIFDALFDRIAQAEKLIVLDMFLYNEFTGENGEVHRRLCEALTTALIERRKAVPNIRIILITDPVNTVYGSLEAEHFSRLEAAGVEVVTTHLDRLRDSNPLWSSPWRLLVKPFGNAPGEGTVSSPFGPQKVTIRSWLKMLNFKANHRKTAVMDTGQAPVSETGTYPLWAWISSANPHDGSSAHDNVALTFTGPAALDVLETEKAVLAFSGYDPARLETIPGRSVCTPAVVPADDAGSLRILTEGAVATAAKEMITRAAKGDDLDLVMFYLADRGIVKALKQAHRRGVNVRVLLDPNKDAFGRIKKGVPNRPVARELVKVGVPLRWADTHGEQAHGKLLLLAPRKGAATLLLGSANFTRRNLRNYNLETNVLATAPKSADVIRSARTYVDTMWTNRDGSIYTTGYETYRDHSLWKRIRYRIQEFTGMCTW